MSLDLKSSVLKAKLQGAWTDRSPLKMLQILRWDENKRLSGPFVLRRPKVRIETDLARTGLNSDRVAEETSNRSSRRSLLETNAASPTSRSKA